MQSGKNDNDVGEGQTDELEISGGLDGGSLRAKGKVVKIFAGLILVSVVAVYSGFDVKKSIIGVIGGSEKQEQNERLEVIHVKARKLVDYWNDISGVDSVDETDKARIAKIRMSKDTIISGYENLKVDQLSNARQIVYLWHLASLKILQADFMSNDAKKAKFALNKAIEYLDEAGELAKDPNSMTPAQLKFIQERFYVERIKRTRLNALALMRNVSNSEYMIKKKELHELFQEFQGCDGLISNGLIHKKILKALECDKSLQFSQKP